MKRAVIGLVFAIMLMPVLPIPKVYAQQRPANAMAVLNQAYKQAALEKKKVLLVISASWNPWSGVLTSAMNEMACKNVLTRHYVVRVLTTKEDEAHKKLENPGADEVFSTYFSANDTLSKETRKLPSLFILEKNKKKLAQYTGFPEGPEGVAEFEKLLRQTSSINDDELAIVKQSFTAAYAKLAPSSANEVLQQACKQAAAENKKVFLIFHASWCHWCHVLDTAMNDAICKKFFLNNYVICHLLVHESDQHLLEQNRGSEQMLAKYQGNRNGIPFWIIFDKEGKHLADFNGFPAPKEPEYKDFEKILQQTSSATDQELKTIKDVFTAVSK